MKRRPLGMLIAAIVIPLLVGGIAGFFRGIALIKDDASVVVDLVAQEKQADTVTPKKLTRERFKLLYPSNWKIDADNDDYDPDHVFSIDSPGYASVMFVFGDMEMNPEENLQEQIDTFSQLLDTTAVEPFETYGQIHGKGAILRGKLQGIKMTVKAFAYSAQGTTAIIVQQYPDEDLGYVKKGLLLIEESFTINSEKQTTPPNTQDVGRGL